MPEETIFVTSVKVDKVSNGYILRVKWNDFSVLNFIAVDFETVVEILSLQFGEK